MMLTMTTAADVCRAALVSTIKTCFALFSVTVNSCIIFPICNTLPESLVPKKLRMLLLKKGTSLNISLKTVQVMWRVRYRKALCRLQTGMKAPNVEVLSLEKKRLNLLDFEKPGRMLVINFGSCT